jgi:positive regulator of sigma E activity
MKKFEKHLALYSSYLRLMKTNIGRNYDSLIASIAFFIVGFWVLGSYNEDLRAGGYSYVALGIAFMFACAFANLGFFLIERYRRKHSSLMK